MVLLKRLVGTFFWPNETFADINREPGWAVPIVVAMLVAFLSGVVFNQRFAIDWERLIRDRYQTSRQAEPSTDVIQQQAGVAKRVFKYSPLINALITAVNCFVLAAVFAVGLILIAAQTTFKKILAVIAWSSCAVGILTAIVMATVLLLRGSSDIDPTSPDSVVLTSLAFILPASSGPTLRAFLSSFDIFTIYFLILLIIGFAQIGGSPKITKSTTAGLVLGTWMIWIAVKVGWVATFGT